MMRMGLDAGFTFVYLSPSELLTAYFKLAAVFGLFVSLPVILYELWRFASPALELSEKKAGRAGLAAGFVFFLLGMVFCYFIALPFMVRFLSNFNTSEYIASNISVAEFLNFMLGMLVTFGLVFELPILTLMLSRLRLLRPAWMVRTRKYAVLVIFIIAAVVTPPDVLSQVMIALPMIGLYELSILLSRMVWKRMDREDGQPDATE
jgi:sec-independent protein translocase protein TatC